MKSCPNETIHGVTRELDTKQYLEEFLFFSFFFLILVGHLSTTNGLA
jgi:hypothetical protein